MIQRVTAQTPNDTFEFGKSLGASLKAGDAVLLSGGLGAGKTLLTKGILSALKFDVDEVTSPSFALVNLYRTPLLDVYHIDLWRIADGANATLQVGLDEIVTTDNSVTIVEWAEKLEKYQFPGTVYRIAIIGDGLEPRQISTEIE